MAFCKQNTVMAFCKQDTVMAFCKQDIVMAFCKQQGIYTTPVLGLCIEFNGERLAVVVEAAVELDGAIYIGHKYDRA